MRSARSAFATHRPARPGRRVAPRPALHPRLEALEDRSLPATGLAAYGQLPLSFEANLGQAYAASSFLAHGPGYSLALGPTQAVLGLTPAPASSAAGDLITMQLVGANAASVPQGMDRLPGVSNYFVGNDPSRWHLNIPNFARVQFSGVYAGVDLVYYGNQRQLEYDFTVAPGADPAQIRLAFQGARSVTLDAQGNLVLHAAGGDVIEHAPVVYQTVAGARQPVAGRYVLNADGTVGFSLGAYDHGRPLTIDPVLGYSTYLGGTGNDSGNDIAVDGIGNAYIISTVNSTNFPTASPFQGTYGGGANDIMVSKINAAGNALVYSTYLGGNAADFGIAIAVDATNDAIVTGYSSSTNFPTANALQPGYGGGASDAIVTKIGPTGNTLVYSTYLGGSGDDFGRAVALDSSGNVYLVGSTDSTDFATVNPVQAGYGGGNQDAFLAKINAAGSSLAYSTYLGGGGDDYGRGIAVDASGNATFTGYTSSTNFPTKNALRSTYAGGLDDGFVGQLTPSGSQVYSTYLGGSDDDLPRRVALDGAGNAYVTGWTTSTNFPTASAFQASYAGGPDDAFITKINSGGGSLGYSTYLGGSGDDIGRAIAVDSAGNAYVTGYTSSTNFPTAAAVRASYAGGLDDAFITALNPSGSTLAFSTYLGGAADDFGLGIALDSSNNVYVVGATFSSNFPTLNPVQATYKGNQDAFIVKLVPTATITGLSQTTAAEGAAGFTLTVNGSNFTNGATVNWNGTALTTTFVNSGQLQATVPASLLAEEGSASVTVTTSGGPSNAQTFTLTDAALTAGTAPAGLSWLEGDDTGTVVLGTLTDANPNAPLSDFANSTISWGDNTTSPATVQVVSRSATSATFQIVGHHVYAEEGTYTVSISLHDVGGQAASVPGPTVSILPQPTLAAANSGSTPMVFTVTPGHSLYFDVPGTNWVKLGDNVQAISAVTDQVTGHAIVFALTLDHALYYYDGAWFTLGAPGTILAASAGNDSNGKADVFVMLSNQSMTEWRGSAGWVGAVLGGRGSILQMSALKNDRVAVVTTGHGVFEFDLHTGWSALNLPRPAQTVTGVTDSAGQDVINAIAQDGSLWQHSSAGWVMIGGAGANLLASAGLDTSGHANVFVSTAGNALAEFDNGGWSLTKSGVNVAELAATVSDRVFAVLSDGSVFERDPTFGWFALTGPGFADT